MKRNLPLLKAAHFFSSGQLDVCKDFPHIKLRLILLCFLNISRGGSRKCFMAVRLEVYRKKIEDGILLIKN